MSGARIGELLPANREEGPGRPITIRPGEMISGRHRQAEHSQACVGHQSGFVDDRAVAPRYWRPREPGPIRSWPPTALPSDHFPGQTAPNYTAAAIAPVFRQQHKEPVWTFSAC